MTATATKPDSYISVNTKNEPTSYIGPDAVEFFRVRTLKSSIKLHMQCGMIPTRGVTITKMFKLASQFTGKTYKRGEHAKAIADLDVWLNNMASALPIVQQ